MTPAMRAALREAAKAELARRAKKHERLLDFIPRTSPRFMRPTHLARLADILERTEREPIRAIVNLPPRHSKTESILHFIAYRLARRPWETIAYVTYGHTLAISKSRLAREYAVRSGLRLRGDAAAVHEWRTPEMGGALFTSIGGALIGQGANVLIIDDPHKDRAEAESALHRDAVWEWYTGTGYHRVEPGGSVIVCQTRWHPDDLTGRLLKEHPHENWEVVNLPALGRLDETGVRIADDDGDALWPEQWPKEALLKKRGVDAYEWRSQFQQSPVGRGGAVFRDVRWYDPAQLPRGLRISIGIDLAYSEKTKSDYSACVVLGEVDDTVYVLEVVRAQVEVPVFTETVRGIAHRYPGAKVRWHTSTTEAGVAQLLKSLGLPVKHALARADKFVRSQPIAASWNAGHVLVPGGRGANGEPIPPPGWVRDFVSEVTGFTGMGDRHDDMVDAMASAFSAWTKPPSVRHEVYDYNEDDSDD